MQTLPDTYAFDYDESDGVIRFIMIGKSGLSRGQFESAEAAYGGPPVFPFYPDSAYQESLGNTNGNGDSSDNGNGNGNRSGAFGSSSLMSLSVAMSLLLSGLLRS